MKLIFDIEGDNLLDKLTTVWMIVAQEIGTERTYVFSDHAENAMPLSDWPEFASRATVLSGHNIYGYDLPALKMMMGWEPDYEKQKIIDTLILSWMVDYKQKGGHSLGSWGERFNFPKGDFHEFHQYSDEMLKYCIQDVKLNERLFRHLSSQCKAISEKKELFKLGMKTEHDWAYWEMRMRCLLYTSPSPRDS